MKSAMLELVPHMTVAELAARLNITKQGLWRLVKKGVITPPIKFGHRTHVWHAETAEQIIRTRQSKLLAIHLQSIEIMRRNLGKLRRFIMFASKYKLYDPLTCEAQLRRIDELDRYMSNNWPYPFR